MVRGRQVSLRVAGKNESHVLAGRRGHVQMVGEELVCACERSRACACGSAGRVQSVHVHVHGCVWEGGKVSGS